MERSLRRLQQDNSILRQRLPIVLAPRVLESRVKYAHFDVGVGCVCRGYLSMDRGVPVLYGIVEDDPVATEVVGRIALFGLQVETAVNNTKCNAFPHGKCLMLYKGVSHQDTHGIQVLTGPGKKRYLPGPPLFAPAATAYRSSYNSPVESRRFSRCTTLVSVDEFESNPALWRTVIFSFETPREMFRWAGVLGATPQTLLWRDLLHTIPNADLPNVLAARIFFASNERVELKNLIEKKIDKKLSRARLPSMITGTIQMYDVVVGTELPFISNTGEIAIGTSGDIAVDCDILYRGGFKLTFLLSCVVRKTKIPDLLIIVKIKELRGRLTISIDSPPAERLWLGFHGFPQISMEFKFELAPGQEQRSVLGVAIGILPDMSDFITGLIKKQIFADMILPCLDDFPIPNIIDTPPTTPNKPHDDLSEIIWEKIK